MKIPRTAEGIPSGSLYELLDFLAEPLKAAAEELTTDSRRSARLFSSLSYFDNNETKQTEIIASLLRPAGRHAQGTLFLRHLLAKVWPSIQFDDRELQRARVYSNHFVSGGGLNSNGNRFIDIWVRVGDSVCLAIESKAKGAGDQPGQVRAYLDYMKGCCPSGGRYKLLYLSPDGGEPCSQSIPSAEWKKAREEGIAEEQTYADFIRQWLTTSERDVEAARVKFFIEDLLTFIDANEQEKKSMPTELDPAIKKVLHGVSSNDPRSEERRMTLLSIRELSDQITCELLRSFQRNFCQQLKERGMTSSPCIDDDSLCKEEGVINGPQSEFIVGEERVSAYAVVERCSPKYHTFWPHLTIGINIRGIDDRKRSMKLKEWRERARAYGLGEGTGDSNWVWQEVPEGFEDLHSKDTAIRLLDPFSAAEIAGRMQDKWRRFEDCVKLEAARRTDER